ncbi:MAG: hypothetical protein GY749_22965 [Desulfobacteraceae bacterium]|nr:hypothetical protein [Desulfobacteraceae bacterium]
MTARFSKVEITRAVKAVQECGLKVSQVSFDENGYPVVNCVDNVEMGKLVLDEILNNPSHESQDWDEWEKNGKCG